MAEQICALLLFLVPFLAALTIGAYVADNILGPWLARRRDQ